MKKIAGFLMAAAFLIPSVSFAATLTQAQVSAIMGVLQAFGVDYNTALAVQQALAPIAPETTINNGNTPVFGGTIPVNTQPTMNEPTTTPVATCPAQPTLTADFQGQLPQDVIYDKGPDTYGPNIDSSRKVVKIVPGEYYGADVRAHELPNLSRAESGSQYPDLTYIEVALSSNCHPLSQISFSVEMPDSFTYATNPIVKWPGVGGESGPVYSDKTTLVFGTSKVGTFPITITAQDQDGQTAPVVVTLNVTAH